MKILAVCGSNGAWLYPFKKYLVGNIEPRAIFHSKGEKQWNENFPGIKILKSLDEEKWDKIDIIVGAPNCGHSSMMALTNSTFREAKDDESFITFFQAVKKYNPIIFIMENLPKSAENVQEISKNLGYELVEHNISFSELGNSQINRKRYIAIGINKNHYGFTKTMWKKIKPMNTLKTAGELIKGLSGKKEIPELGHFRESLNEEVTIYAGRKIKLSEALGYWLDNPNIKRFKAVDRKYDTAPGVYRNLENEYPAVARKADRQFNHKGFQMSPRELARIQGIPDEFKIYFPILMTNEVKRYWINKGRATVTKCPPYEFGLWISYRIKAIRKSGYLE